MSFQLKKDLFHHLLADAGVSALVGDRIFPNQATIGTAKPYAVLSTVSASQTMTHDGPTGDEKARIQFNITASSAIESEQVASALKAALVGLRQDIGENNDTHISRCAKDNDIDLGVDEETQETEKAIDFIINFNH